MDTERRQDPQERQRIDDLLCALERESRRLEDGRRQNRRAIRMVEIGMVVFLVFFVVGGILLSRQATRVNDTQTSVLTSRGSVTQALCESQNGQSRAVNGVNLYLQNLIVGGAKSSRPFEKVYRQLGLPPYRKRLALAKEQAAGLNGLAVRAIDCPEFALLVRRGNRIDEVPYLRPDFPKLPTAKP